jgi:hypothetical protein
MATDMPSGRYDDVIGNFPGLTNTINARFAHLVTCFLQACRNAGQ